MRNTKWLVLTSTDWEDDLLADFEVGEETDWLTPLYWAVRDRIAPGDEVAFVHGRTRLAHVTGTVTGRPEFVAGSVEWRNGRTLAGREWWPWTVEDVAPCGVELTATEDAAIRHPANEFGGQNGWMAPLPARSFRSLAARIARAS
jgi:hypothetical protein